MAKDKQAKRKARAKARKKARIEASAAELRKEKAEFFFHEALWFESRLDYEKAFVKIEKAFRCSPNDPEILKALGRISHQTGREANEIKALVNLYRIGAIPRELLQDLCWLLIRHNRKEEALDIAEAALKDWKASRRKKEDIAIQKELLQVKGYCEAVSKTNATLPESRTDRDAPPRPRLQKIKQKKTRPKTVSALEKNEIQKKAHEPIPNIPVSVSLDGKHFISTLTGGHFKNPEIYKLALEARRIRFRESYDQLICLPFLQNVQSLPYQEETARKVLKDFRGRALLADEVGLGKTIEAGIVLKEYIQRGMVKNALILTPSSLVSQWREELKSKFGVEFASTGDGNVRAGNNDFWKSPFLLASINVAKSKKHFDTVVKREYDLVIVDEAHHLKNRSTLNWKLVNALKKRFLLLLSATPVENNLMELYNLITLLKPGQLKTATEFRNQFMTRGDPTDPQNRTHLKELLGQVMIRNTRAVARINLPPRFAFTVRVEPSSREQELYERVTQLVRRINADSGKHRKLMLKNLLAAAGSSPQAVSKPVAKLLGNPDLPEPWRRDAAAIVNLSSRSADTRKDEMLLKLIRSMPGKVIVFVKYLATLGHLSDVFIRQGVEHSLFHGGMENAEKDRQILGFRNKKDVLLTTEVGGEGRNLQFCHQMINYDLPWNPMKIEQRIGRIHRIGQEKEVLVHNLCAVGSAEEYILEILDKKINMFEMVIGEIDMILGRIRGEREFSEMIYDIWVQSADKALRDKDFDRLGDQLVRIKNGYLRTRALDDKLFGETYEL